MSKHGHSVKRQFTECRTRQIRHSAKAVFAECQTLGKCPLCRVSGTRQRITLGKIPQATPVAPPSSFAECWPLALGKHAIFAECCKPGTRQRGSFAECQFRHSAKFFFYFCFQIFSMAFIQYLEAHVPIWNFSMTFWYIF